MAHMDGTEGSRAAPTPNRFRRQRPEPGLHEGSCVGDVERVAKSMKLAKIAKIV